jgi:hypothetical protein
MKRKKMNTHSVEQLQKKNAICGAFKVLSAPLRHQCRQSVLLITIMASTIVNPTSPTQPKSKKEKEREKKERDRERKEKAAQHSERLKIVVRKLPPNLPEEIFWQSVQTWVTDETTTWKIYYLGKFRSR